MIRRIIGCFMAVMLASTLVTAQYVKAEEKISNNEVKFDADYLNSVMKMIKEKYNGQVSEQQLLEGALKGMFGSMDPYTVYYDQKETQNFQKNVGGSFEGIGVTLRKIGNRPIITNIFDGSPAQKAGMVIGDIISTVDGKSVEGMTTDEIVGVITGKSGTTVAIGVTRTGMKEITVIEVKRNKITVNPVNFSTKQNIGYIKLDIFNNHSASGIKTALEDMDKQNIKKLIIDLRDNPGGDVDEVVDIAKNFVPQGLITRLDFRSEEFKDREYKSDLKNLKYKVIILVNGNSASASEILAGAIQDTKAGTVVGTKTFGKAKVQSVIPILSPDAYKKYKNELKQDVVDAYDLNKKYAIEPSDDELLGASKITTGFYYTPNGRMIDGVGLNPDIVVEDMAAVGGVDLEVIQKLNKIYKPTLNDEGFDVFNAECMLKAFGYYVGAPDLKLGDDTVKAIAAFQEDVGLFPYGGLDFSTQEQMNIKFEKLVDDNDKQLQKAYELLNEN